MTPRLKSPTDDIIRQYLAQGWTHAEIAASCGVSQPRITKIIQQIQRQDAVANAAKQPIEIEAAKRSVWLTHDEYQRQYERLERQIKLAEENGESLGSLVNAINSARGYLDSARDTMAKLYEIQQIQQWQKTVLDTIGQCAPAVRDEIMLRLKQQRQVSAAFLPPSNS
jgi:sugar-specific transcriptional regulator TrmB